MDGETPLFQAAEFSLSVESLTMLIKAGANPFAKTNKGETPLTKIENNLLLDDNAKKIIMDMIRQINLDDAGEQTKSGDIPFSRPDDAETKGNVMKTQDEGRNDFLQKMIRTISKNNVNNPVFGGLTLLHLAASADTPEFIIELASKGANIEVRDKDGNTALHTAATVNKPKNIAELIKTGADTGAKNNQDMTPLHIAAMTGTVEATVALLEAGADVEARSNGNTALHLASLKGTLDIVVALLEAGASVSAETNKGATPLAIAIQKNNMEVAELLRKAGVKENHEDILLSRFDEVGINDPLDNKGTTRLHLALIRDVPEAIAQLVKMGANLESRSADGSTPLHLAVASDNARIVSALLEAGADTETKSSDGLTALHYAAGTGNVDIARMLLKAGADVGAAAPNGLTPLRFAEAKNNYQVADLLRNATTQYKTQSIENMTPKERLTKGARLIKRRAETREQIRALEARKTDPDEVSFSNYCNDSQNGTHVGCGCLILIAAGLFLGWHALYTGINGESGFGDAYGTGWLLGFGYFLLIGGGIACGIMIKNHYEQWKKDRLLYLNSELAKAKSELTGLDSALSWYDNLPKTERDKFDAAILAEEKRQEEERKRQEQERLRRESICPQCKKEWALSTSWEMVGTNNEFRTELKEEWVQTGRGLTDGFYQKIPIQIQTVVTTEMNVTKCKYCNYRREGTTRENRREIR